jgi:restriction system protein
MPDSYEELMLPLFLRLGGDERQLHMDAVVHQGSPEQEQLGLEAPHIVASAHRASMRELEQKVLAFVYAQPADFFERLIIDLLLAMGYAGRQRDLARQVGRSHDGGIDGVIAQDPLGLDVILLQGKRLKPNASVSSSQIRDFIGSLETKQARKGVFVTTGSFSRQARDTLGTVSRRVRLIDGQELSGLMVRHNLGVKPVNSYVFKTIDRNYFCSGLALPALATSA